MLRSTLIFCAIGISSAFAAADTARQGGSIAPTMFAQAATKKPGAATRPYPRLAKASPYAKARETLLAAGWEPVVSADADPCEAGDGRCEGRPEMESCAGTGEGNCLFVWRKGKAVIAVTTYDDPPKVASVSCRSGCR